MPENQSRFRSNALPLLALLLLLATFSTGPSLQAQTFSTGSGPLGPPPPVHGNGFPFGDSGGTQTSLDVTRPPGTTGRIEDLNVSLSLTTQFFGDLEVTLTSPSGTTLELWSNLYGSDDSEHFPNPTTYTFDDEAQFPFQNIPQPDPTQVPGGTYRLESPGALSIFNGEPIDGTWTLTLINDFQGFSGESAFLFDWRLFYQLEALPPVIPDPFIVIDHGAIMSANSTGLLIPTVQRSSVQRASSLGMDDLNNRIFRARNTAWDSETDTPIFSDGFESGDVSAWSQSQTSHAPSSLNRYLNFASNQNIDSRVALGLAEGREVVVDTLVADDSVWIGHPFAMAGGPLMVSASTKAVVAVPEGSAKNPFSAKEVYTEGHGPRRYEVYTAFDYGFYDQDNLTQLVRAFDTDSYAGSMGIEYRLAPWLMAGGAFSHVWSDTNIISNLGSVDLEGQILSGYVTAFWKGLYFDVLYRYGDYDNEIRRNTLLGRMATGDTDSFSHTISLNTGMNYALSDRIVAGPFAGLDYSTGGIDGYQESNGGSATLLYPDDDFESMIGRVGWQVSHHTDTKVGRFTSQLALGWAHEFMPEADSVSTSLVNSPFTLVTPTSPTAARTQSIGGYSVASDSAHAGQDWLELDAAVRWDFGNAWNFLLGYQGQFARNNAKAHFATAKLAYEWGDNLFVPRVKEGETGGKTVIMDEPDTGDLAKTDRQTKGSSEIEPTSSPDQGPAAAEQAVHTAVGTAEQKPRTRKGFFAKLFPGNRIGADRTGIITETSDDRAPLAAPASEIPSTEAPSRSTPALPTASSQGEPVIYESWDEVPGRTKKTKLSSQADSASEKPAGTPPVAESIPAEADPLSKRASEIVATSE